MKPKPSSIDLQSRLYLVFSILFGFCVVALAFFLTSSVRMVSLNNHAREVFDRNRKLYQLSSLTQQYEMAMRTFENASDETTYGNAWEQIPAYSSRIDDSVTAMRPELDGEFLTRMDQFFDYKKQVSTLYDQIIAASEDEDWEQVYALDEQAYQVIEPMYAELDAAIAIGVDELDWVRLDMNIFSIITWISAILAVPIFISLSLVAALVIYLQINRPLEVLTGAAKKVLTSPFDPSDLNSLASRRDEVGTMAREFLTMINAIHQRTANLQQEAVELRQKIR